MAGSKKPRRATSSANVEVLKLNLEQIADGLACGKDMLHRFAAHALDLDSPESMTFTVDEQPVAMPASLPCDRQDRRPAAVGVASNCFESPTASGVPTKSEATCPPDDGGSSKDRLSPTAQLCKGLSAASSRKPRGLYKQVKSKQRVVEDLLATVTQLQQQNQRLKVREEVLQIVISLREVQRAFLSGEASPTDYQHHVSVLDSQLTTPLGDQPAGSSHALGRECFRCQTVCQKLESVMAYVAASEADPAGNPTTGGCQSVEEPSHLSAIAAGVAVARDSTVCAPTKPASSMLAAHAANTAATFDQRNLLRGIVYASRSDSAGSAAQANLRPPSAQAHTGTLSSSGRCMGQSNNTAANIDGGDAYVGHPDQAAAATGMHKRQISGQPHATRGTSRWIVTGDGTDCAFTGLQQHAGDLCERMLSGDCSDSSMLVQHQQALHSKLVDLHRLATADSSFYATDKYGIQDEQFQAAVGIPASADLYVPQGSESPQPSRPADTPFQLHASFGVPEQDSPRNGQAYILAPQGMIPLHMLNGFTASGHQQDNRVRQVPSSYQSSNAQTAALQRLVDRRDLAADQPRGTAGLCDLLNLHSKDSQSLYGRSRLDPLTSLESFVDSEPCLPSLSSSYATTASLDHSYQLSAQEVADLQMGMLLSHNCASLNQVTQGHKQAAGINRGSWQEEDAGQQRPRWSSSGTTEFQPRAVSFDPLCQQPQFNNLTAFAAAAATQHVASQVSRQAEPFGNLLHVFVQQAAQLTVKWDALPDQALADQLEELVHGLIGQLQVCHGSIPEIWLQHLYINSHTGNSEAPDDRLWEGVARQLACTPGQVDKLRALIEIWGVAMASMSVARKGLVDQLSECVQQSVNAVHRASDTTDDQDAGTPTGFIDLHQFEIHIGKLEEVAGKLDAHLAVERNALGVVCECCWLFTPDQMAKMLVASYPFVPDLFAVARAAVVLADGQQQL